MRRAIFFAAALACGCSLTVDGDQPPLPLAGLPPSTNGLQLIEKPDFQAMQLVVGADGVTWAALFATSDEGIIGPVRLVRLADPVREVLYDASFKLVSRHVIYLSDESSSLPLQVVQPGDDPKPFGVQVPPNFGGGQITPSENDLAFLYQPPTTPSFAIIRSDGSYTRELPLDVPGPGAFTRPPMISPDGDWAFTFESDGRTTAHLSKSELDIRLGSWRSTVGGVPEIGQVFADDRHQQLIFCDGRGVTVMPYDGAAPRVLDPAACVQLPPGTDDSQLAQLAGDDFFYWSSDGARMVPLDGSAPPRTVTPGQRRVLAYGTPGLAYSLDQVNRFVGGAGDGWVGDWRFMDRGKAVTFSTRGRGLRFLEHTADDAESGDLSSSVALGSPPRRLARNVTQYDELDDGRLVAEADRAYENSSNRVIVLDEVAGTARWVAEGVRRYTLIPGSRSVLGELISDKPMKQLVRFPIPPRGP